MDICEDIFNALSAEFVVLGDDGIVHKAIFARESGDRQNPHLIGHALVSLNEASEGKAAVVFKRMLRGIILAAAERTRMSVKINRLADWLYCVGYDDKARINVDVDRLILFMQHPLCHTVSAGLTSDPSPLVVRRIAQNQITSASLSGLMTT